MCQQQIHGRRRNSLNGIVKRGGATSGHHIWTGFVAKQCRRHHVRAIVLPGDGAHSAGEGSEATASRIQVLLDASSQKKLKSIHILAVNGLVQGVVAAKRAAKHRPLREGQLHQRDGLLPQAGLHLALQLPHLLSRTGRRWWCRTDRLALRLGSLQDELMHLEVGRSYGRARALKALDLRRRGLPDVHGLFARRLPKVPKSCLVHVQNSPATPAADARCARVLLRHQGWWRGPESP
mmetsp:Transcript_67183/g.157578  ORF Transcript_67183/g.157578 Transcript_67183/m.157578 type:complete len:236 (-) Transcript_67183:147-854(-)